MTKQTQRAKIWQYLQKYPVTGITPKQAEDMFGCMRLAARIDDLKKIDGREIITQRATGKNRYGEVVHFARYVAGEY